MRSHIEEFTGRLQPPDMSILERLGRRKFVSVSGLAEVLKEIRDHGMPDSISRSSIKRARERAFENESGPYGKIVKSVQSGFDENGIPCTFWYADPRACLYYMLGESSKLRDFIMQRLMEKPSSPNDPWGIIIYND